MKTQLALVLALAVFSHAAKLQEDDVKTTEKRGVLGVGYGYPGLAGYGGLAYGGYGGLVTPLVAPRVYGGLHYAPRVYGGYPYGGGLGYSHGYNLGYGYGLHGFY